MRNRKAGQIGANIKNTQSKLTSHGLWMDQKRYNSKIDYGSVYQLLDELTQQGYNCFQIREIIETGIKCYKK